jgi:hypothetical protein
MEEETIETILEEISTSYLRTEDYMNRYLLHIGAVDSELGRIPLDQINPENSDYLNAFTHLLNAYRSAVELKKLCELGEKVGIDEYEENLQTGKELSVIVINHGVQWIDYNLKRYRNRPDPKNQRKSKSFLKRLLSKKEQ